MLGNVVGGPHFCSLKIFIILFSMKTITYNYNSVAYNTFANFTIVKELNPVFVRWNVKKRATSL